MVEIRERVSAAPACLLAGLLLFALSGWAEDEAPKPEPAPGEAKAAGPPGEQAWMLTTPGARLEAQVYALVGQLGGADTAARETARAALKELGRRITPLLVQALRLPDKELAARVRSVLIEMVGAPRMGEEVAGLTFGVVPVGLPPPKDACVPLWVVLKNTSAGALSFREVCCDLFWTAPERAAELLQKPGGLPLKQHTSEHFCRTLQPGEEISYLADADLEGAEPERHGRVVLPLGVTGVARGCAVLRVALRPLDGAEADTPYRACWRRSGEFELEHYDPQRATPEEREMRWSRNYAALRIWNETARWLEFQAIRDQPHPLNEDDFVEFLGRWSLRNVKGDQIGQWLRIFADGLPAYRRIPFLDRLSRAASYVWLDNAQIAAEYSKRARNMLEVNLAARVSRRLLDAGYRIADMLPFTVWQLHMSQDPEVYDPARARELLQYALARTPDSIELAFMKLTFEGQEAVRAGLLRIASAEPKQKLAWFLATAARAAATDRALGVRLAQEALAETPPDNPEYHLRADTLAAAHAAQGQFAQAAETQKLALDALQRTPPLTPAKKAVIAVPAQVLCRAYASRFFQYEALKLTPAGSVFDVAAMRNTEVRDFLRARVKEETVLGRRRAATDWLELLFPNDRGLLQTERPELDF